MSSFGMNVSPFWNNGPTPGGFYNFPGNPSTSTPSEPRQVSG
jgi:hypothetical protein